MADNFIRETVNWPDVPSALYDKPDTSLQLLVIDLGDCCVVKVERGEMSAMFAVEGRGYHFTEIDRVKCLPHPFAAVRDAIDSQDKPVPRLARNGEYGVTLVHNDPPCEDNAPFTELSERDYDALRTIAGHSLPIWDGGGKWEQLPNPEADDRVTFCDFSFGFNAAKDQLPFKAWRYTKQG